MIDTIQDAFATEVFEGLSARPKRLSSKWLYDEIGDQLFVNIMDSEEYYLTRCEFEILSEQTSALVESFGVTEQCFDLYELGAGDGTKTIELLKGLKQFNYTYKPVDISHNAISTLEGRIQNELPEVDIDGRHGEYFDVLSSMHSDNPKVILFMGSNIGNLMDDQANNFLMQLSSVMQSGDKLLLGVDLKKSKDIILPAYNDAQGYTADFNLNLLDRMNKELGANFDRSKFIHRPVYDEHNGYAKSYLQSTQQQVIDIERLESSFSFEKGETIYTEVSRKYDDEIIAAITRNTGLEIVRKFYDRKKYFCDVVFSKR